MQDILFIFLDILRISFQCELLFRLFLSFQIAFHVNISLKLILNFRLIKELRLVDGHCSIIFYRFETGLEVLLNFVKLTSLFPCFQVRELCLFLPLQRFLFCQCLNLISKEIFKSLFSTKMKFINLSSDFVIVVSLFFN